MNRLLASALSVLFLAPSITLAQSDAPFVLKTDSKFLQLFRDAIARAADATVRIKSDGKDVALGTIVADDGWIVTKASQIGKEVICLTRDGKEMVAKVTAVHEPFDLALLKVEAKNLTPIRMTQSKIVPPGHWVAATGIGEAPVAVGVVSAPARTLSKRELDIETMVPQGGYLGIQMEPIEGGIGVKVIQVMPNTAASKAGLKKDDVVLKIEGQSIDKQQKVFEILSKTRPGDSVKMLVQRGDEELELNATLGKRPSQGRSDFQNSMGSELSQRRAGFPTILQHDTVLRPIDCGGPLVDLEGRVIGINLARSGRVESVAIPTEALEPLLKDLKSGKSTPPTAIKRFQEPEKKTSSGTGLGNLAK